MQSEQKQSNLWCVRAQFDAQRERIVGLVMLTGLESVTEVLRSLQAKDVEPMVEGPFVKACEEETGVMSIFGIPEAVTVLHDQMVALLEESLQS